MQHAKSNWDNITDRQCVHLSMWLGFCNFVSYIAIKNYLWYNLPAAETILNLNVQMLQLTVCAWHTPTTCISTVKIYYGNAITINFSIFLINQCRESLAWQGRGPA